MGEKTEYVINMHEKYGPLTLMDLPQLVDATQDKWFNQTLGHVNDSVIRLGIFEGEFHWHKHDEEDELFLTLQGEFYIDIEGQPAPVVLKQHQGYIVPKGVVHRTRSPQKSVVLMVEKSGVVPTGDA
jgi:mannose-6-phosphate isomerase-like protein (cupin superfamily)